MSLAKSRALSQNSFVQPPRARDDDELAGLDSTFTRRQKRQANVYDAVAGRVNAHGFLGTLPFASRYRDTISSNARPVHPEEVLFRRQNAPTRYEENDFYFAHESLPSDQRHLPSSDLLEAIHAYSADFYEHATIDHGADDFQTLDETALIAMGILLEEMAKESLGETGDLVLVEGEEVSDDENDFSLKVATGLRRKRSNTEFSSFAASSADELRKVLRRRKKRRRTNRARTVDVTTDLDTQPDDGG